MALIRFERLSAPTGSVNFTRNPIFRRPNSSEFAQPEDRSGGGDLYIYDQGLDPERMIELEFKGMPAADHTALMTFLETKVRRAAYSFTFYDYDSSSYTVRCMSNPIELDMVNGRWYGRLRLRIE